MSLPDGMGLDTEDMLDISHEVSDLFYPKYQLLCGAHAYHEHIHAHFAINPVPMQVGRSRKLNMDYSFMSELSQKVEKIIADHIYD